MLRPGVHSGGIALKSGQTLAGKGATIAGRVTVSGTSGVVTIRDLSLSTLIVKKAARLVTSGIAVASVDGPAVAIADADLDASFDKVSARGGKQAILLERTTGRFTVVGSGEAGSGGTIEGGTTGAVTAIEATNVTLKWMHFSGNVRENGAAPAACGSGNNEKCNAVIYLRNVSGAFLEGVLIDGSKQAGLAGHRVRDLQIVSSEIRNAGDEVFEHGVVLQELSGDSRIVASKIHRNAARQLMLRNETAALKLAIIGTTFSDNSPQHGQQGILITTAGDAFIDLSIEEAIVARHRSHGLEVIAEGDSTVKTSVRKSRFDRNASAINLAVDESATLDYTIADNPSIVGSSSSAINVFMGARSRGNLMGAILRNVIGEKGVATSGTSCPGCGGIVLTATGGGSLIADVGENIIQEVGGSGVHAGAGSGSARVSVTVRANLLRAATSQSSPAVRVHSGTGLSDTTVVCADIGGPGVHGNTIEGTWEPNGAIHLLHRFGGARFEVAGLSGGNSDEAAARSVSQRNRGARVRAALRPDATKRGFERVEHCTMPRLTP